MRLLDGNICTVQGHGRTWPARSFRARFFIAIIFHTSMQVVWKGATASLPPKGVQRQVRALHSRPHVGSGWPHQPFEAVCLATGWGRGCWRFQREDRRPGPWQRGLRAPFPSNRLSDVAPAKGRLRISGFCGHPCRVCASHLGIYQGNLMPLGCHVLQHA